MNNGDFHFLMALLVACVATIAMFIMDAQKQTLRKEAVERGHAEYVTDSDGNTTWQWKGGDK